MPSNYGAGTQSTTCSLVENRRTASGLVNYSQPRLPISSFTWAYMRVPREKVGFFCCCFFTLQWCWWGLNLPFVWQVGALAATQKSTHTHKQTNMPTNHETSDT